MKKQKLILIEDSISKIGIGLLMSGFTSILNDPNKLIIGGFIHCDRGAFYSI